MDKNKLKCDFIFTFSFIYKEMYKDMQAFLTSVTLIAINYCLRNTLRNQRNFREMKHIQVP